MGEGEGEGGCPLSRKRSTVLATLCFTQSGEEAKRLHVFLAVIKIIFKDIYKSGVTQVVQVFTDRWLCDIKRSRCNSNTKESYESQRLRYKYLLGI